MAGIEALRDPLEVEVVEKALAPKADERLGEIEVPLLPFLPEPRVPACLHNAFHHLGTDRDAKWLVFREGSGGVEGDERPSSERKVSSLPRDRRRPAAILAAVMKALTPLRSARVARWGVTP